VTTRRSRSIDSSPACSDAPEHRLYPRHQLTDAEGFGQVVVGAELQAEHAVELGGLGRRHQDRHVARPGAQALADLQAVQAGQHQVEDHQVVGLRLSLRQASGAVEGEADLATQVGQVQADQLGDVAVVFDDEDAARRARA
jgi:hypothetical protein